MQKTEERTFLHDIASPLGTALFLLDMMIDTAEESPHTNPNDLTQKKQLYVLMKRMKKMVEERRDTLIHQGAPNSKTS